MKQEPNRIIEFVEELNSNNIRDWDAIVKAMNEKFGATFRFNRTEADYLTKYYKGQLNFNTKVISQNFKTTIKP
jgi:hypothetical protein